LIPVDFVYIKDQAQSGPLFQVFLLNVID